jgi:hypothetical protein
MPFGAVGQATWSSEQSAGTWQPPLVEHFWADAGQSALVAQPSPQTPSTQRCVPLHFVPQPPQLLLSLFTSAQTAWVAPSPPLQRTRPPPQVRPHLPSVQTSPAPHLVPQAPQFDGSTFESTQAVPHWVVPAPHEDPQVPWLQTWPSAHLVPQAPQLAASVFVSTQEAPHCV